VFYAAFSRELGVSPLRYMATKASPLSYRSEVMESLKK
jgi:AraC-like DNA-binding protein